jgi:hypothetical protein
MGTSSEEHAEHAERRIARAAAVAAAVWVVLLGASAGAVAWAGEYHVYSCRMPDGEVAPTDGWSESTSLSQTIDHTENACPSGGLGGMVAGLRSGHAHPANTDLATWAFNAPSGETIGAATLWRAGDTAGGGNSSDSYLFWLTGVANHGESTVLYESCDAFKGCHEKGDLEDPLAASNRVEVPNEALHSPYLSLNASCGSLVSGSECPSSPGDINGYATIIKLFAADITLNQETAPTVQEVSGSLATAATVSGSSDVAFTATDPGAGVYEAVFQVDGQVVSSTALDANGGRCHDVGQTTDGLPAFLYTQPCEHAVTADVPFDTTSLSEGPHHLVVSVTDAAGNSTPVVDRQITVAQPSAGGGQSGGGQSAGQSSGQSSPGPGAATGAGQPASRGAPNGSEASENAVLSARWRGVGGMHITSAFGQAHTVQGRLTTPAGHAIAGALIDVSLAPAAAGAHTLALPGAHTDSAGRFTITLPRAAPSGALRLGYRSRLGDTLPVATRTLALSVRAGVQLHITPRTSAAGHTIHFSGRLLGGPVPPGGKQLILEARSPGTPWIEFNVIRSDAHGAFHASYRFRLPGPVAYSFRVLSPGEADYPFLAGASNVVGVLER